MILHGGESGGDQTGKLGQLPRGAGELAHNIWQTPLTEMQKNVKHIFYLWLIIWEENVNFYNSKQKCLNTHRSSLIQWCTSKEKYLFQINSRRNNIMAIKHKKQMISYHCNALVIHFTLNSFICVFLSFGNSKNAFFGWK